MSMSLKIVKHYLRLLTASEILSALTKALYDESENYKFFLLETKIFCCQEKWKTTLCILWRVDRNISRVGSSCDKVVMKHPEVIEAYKKYIEWLRVHIFLAK